MVQLFKNNDPNQPNVKVGQILRIRNGELIKVFELKAFGEDQLHLKHTYVLGGKVDFWNYSVDGLLMPNQKHQWDIVDLHPIEDSESKPKTQPTEKVRKMPLLGKVKVEVRQDIQPTDIIVFRDGSEAEVLRIETDEEDIRATFRVFFKREDGNTGDFWYDQYGYADYQHHEKQDEDIVKIVKQA